MSGMFKGPTGDCPHHGGLQCPIHNRKCHKCGWSEPVKQERLKEIRKKLKEEEK